MTTQDEVTLFITACNRPHLLKTTVETFARHNTYPIKEAIIMEDSGRPGINEFAKDVLPFPCTTFYNEKRGGLLKSIEKGLAHVTTPWVFHCEDDWEFLVPGFIEVSMDILKKDPKVVTVFLRGHEDNRRHNIQVEDLDRGGYRYIKPIMIANPPRCAGVLTHNPGLRTLEVAMAKTPFSTTEDEGTLGLHFYEAGMFGAEPTDPTAFMRHTGFGQREYGKTS